MTNTIDPTDTSTWLPLDGLAPGFDANKQPPTTTLRDQEITVVDERGTRITHRFGSDTVTWTYSPGTGDSIPESTGTDDYEAFDIDPGLVYAQFQHSDQPNESVSLILDFTTGHALSVITTIGEPVDSGPRVGQLFVPARIEGSTANGDAPAPTTALVGKRTIWFYSSQHAYEHVYLSPRWYSWQCLAGPESGLADTDECTTYELRPGIYLFAWREKVVPCASVTVADHRNTRALCSHGVLFGPDESGASQTQFTFGANGYLLSNTVHPAHYDPAQQH